MTRRVRQLISLVAATAALCAPAAAWGSPDAVIQDCASDGSLDGSYSDADKRAALGQLGAELQEYSDCRSVIGASIGGGSSARGSSSSDGGGNDSAASAGNARKRRGAKDAKSRDQADKRRATEVALGGRGIEPDEPGALDSEDTANGISTPALLALIALGLMGAAGLLFLLSKRSPRVADAFRRVSFARFRR